MKLYSKIANLFIVSSLLLCACNDDVDPIVSTAQWRTTHTITDLISSYASEIGDLPTRTPNLFSVDTIPSKQNIVIQGVVTSNDNEGNIYKYLVIQDTYTGQALKVSVDAGNLSAIFPVGRLISINCSGLAIGKYAGMLQLGVYFYNTESGKTGFEIGRIPYSMFMKRVQINRINSIPMSQIVDTVTLSEIRSSGPEMHGKLVCIKGAYFTGNGSDYGKPKAIEDALKIFAPPTNNVGFPQSREITDGTGSVFISTSEYSKFATKRLPSPTYSGNITAIVGWYNDKDASIDPQKIYHQLTLRSIYDLGKGFERYHQGY